MGSIGDTWDTDEHKRDSQLDVLIAAYHTERAYDAQTLSTLTGVFATIIGVLSVVGSAIAFGFLHPQGLPRLLTTFLPVIPFPFLGWGAFCAHTIITRGEVIEFYEAALRRAARLRIGTKEGRGGLPVPSGAALVGRVWWHHGPVMLANFFVIGVMYIGILVLSAYLADARGDDWAIFLVFLPCLGGFMGLLHTYLQAFRPRDDLTMDATELFGTPPPFEPHRREATRLWRAIGGRGRAKTPYALMLLVAILGGVTVYVKRASAPPPASPETKAVLFAAELAATMNHKVVTYVRRSTGTHWMVKLADSRSKQNVCFTVDTSRFALDEPRGFAVVPCPT